MPGKNAVEGGRLLYTFECKSLASHGTFVVGNLQLNPKQAEGINVAVLRSQGSLSKRAEFRRECGAFRDRFFRHVGPIPDPKFHLESRFPTALSAILRRRGVLLLSQHILGPQGQR